MAESNCLRGRVGHSVGCSVHMGSITVQRLFYIKSILGGEFRPRLPVWIRVCPRLCRHSEVVVSLLSKVADQCSRILPVISFIAKVEEVPPYSSIALRH